MNGAFLNKILRIDAKHALYRKDGKWYHNLKKFPGVLFDANGYILFSTKEAYESHPQLQRKNDLHVVGGIRSLKEYNHFTAYQKNLVFRVPNTEQSERTDFSRETSLRAIREVNTILRKRSLVNRIKQLYDHQCQICGTRIEIRNGQFYSEVHHIIPLGEPYNGKDSMDNMLCVCPNHHALLDFNSIPLDTSTLMLTKHQISQASLAHHNKLYRDYGVRDNQE